MNLSNPTQSALPKRLAEVVGESRNHHLAISSESFGPHRWFWPWIPEIKHQDPKNSDYISCNWQVFLSCWLLQQTLPDTSVTVANKKPEEKVNRHGCWRIRFDFPPPARTGDKKLRGDCNARSGDKLRGTPTHSSIDKYSRLLNKLWF